MNKTKQFIIGMLLGFDKDHEIFEGIDFDSDMAGGLIGGVKITKDDLFSTTENDKSFFEYKQTWVNLGKLLNVMKENGEEIAPEDFRKPIKGQKSALDMASDCSATEEIFVPEMWAGRREEMEKTWYAIDKWKRPKIDFDDVRIAVAKLEGKTLREETLKEMGIDPEDMYKAIKEGKLDDMKAKLDAKGGHFTLDDAKLRDGDGDHALYAKAGWDKFDQLFAEWEAHGEIPDADFFLFKNGDRESIIDKAFTHTSQGKVFNATVFAGRPDEAVKLHSALKDDQKKKVDINALVSEIVENECGSQLLLDDSVSVEKLTEAMYVIGEGTEEGPSPIIPLGLKTVWENMERISAALGAKGESITMSDLRKPCGLGGDTCLHRAARFSAFDKVLDMIAKSGDKLSVDDLSAKNSNDESVLDILSETGQVDLLLDSNLWVGRTGDLAALWEQMPSETRVQKRDEFLAVQTRANQLSLRTLGGGGAAPSATRAFAPA